LKRLLTEAPDAIIDSKPMTCARCAAPRSGDDPQPRRHQVAEIPPQVIITTEYRLHTLRCSCCGTDNKASVPAGVGRGAFGPRLSALCMYLRGALQVSRRDVQDLLEAWGCPVSLGALTDMQHRTSTALARPYDEAVAAVQEAACVHADETSRRQGRSRRWMWVACCAAATVFKAQARRNTACAKALLGDRAAGLVVVTDRLGSYNWIPHEDRFQGQ
jgi:transposase